MHKPVAVMQAVLTCKEETFQQLIVRSNVAEPGTPVCQQQSDIEIYFSLFIQGCITK